MDTGDKGLKDGQPSVQHDYTCTLPVYPEHPPPLPCPIPTPNRRQEPCTPAAITHICSHRVHHGGTTASTALAPPHDTHTACRAPASTRRHAPRLSAHPGRTGPVRCAWTRHRRAVSSRLSIPRSKMRGNPWRNTRCPAAAPRRKTGTVTKWRAGTDVHNPPRHLCQDLALSRASVKLTACS